MERDCHARCTGCDGVGNTVIEPERIQLLNDKPQRDGEYVLYWMQASQRAEYNHALEYAIQEANRLRLPLVAVFGITEKFPEANERHYAFMLEGLRETRQALQERGIQMVVVRQSPEKAALELAESAALLVTDRGYPRIQRAWRETAARRARCPVVQVESDAVVPIEVVSNKEEYAAATLRPKILRRLNDYLAPMRKTNLRRDSLGLHFDGLDLEDPDKILRLLRIDRSVPRQAYFLGGTSEAKKHLRKFITEQLDDYAERRNDPSLGIQSNLSPYLHFGQISPLYVALQVHAAQGKNRAAKEAFLEELIIRRELSLNFVYFNPEYDSYQCIPAWARQTLYDHRRDPRDYLYHRGQFETAQTHDPYWNAAMLEMRITGKMANYMRMYWAKKILEWSPSPEDAYRNILHLDNKYFLDGRDPNSFAGVAWCFGKHDRPWSERAVFGKVRYMNDGGLRRKFDIEGYVRKVGELVVSGGL